MTTEPLPLPRTRDRDVQDAAEPVRIGVVQERIAFAILYVSSLLITGYQAYIDNNSFQIALVHRYADATAYRGDPFMDTAPYYASVLWHAIAFASRIVPPLLQLGALFLIERFLALWSFRALALALAPESRLAALGAVALAALAPQPLIGGGTIVPGYMEQTGLAVPFLVLAIAAFVRGRPMACAVLLGLGFDLNSMYGAYVITYLLAMGLTDRTVRERWQSWMMAGLVFLVVASPAIVLSFQALSRGESDRELWLWASRVRFPHHLYPMTWSKAALAHFGLLFALVSVVAWTLRGQTRAGALTLACSATAAVWLVVAFLAPISGSPTLLTLHPARATDVWHVFGGIFLVCMAARALEQRTVNPPLGNVVFLSALAAWFAPPAPLVLAGILAAGLLSGGSPARFARWLRLAALIVGVVVVAGAATAGLRVIKARSLAALLGGRPNPELVRVGEWASHHTPRDAVFLSDPFWLELRPLARRPLFTTWKDGAAILWDRSFVTEWTARMEALGLPRGADVTDKEARAIVADHYRRLSDDRVRELRRRFGIDYWVVRRDHASALPVVFETEGMKVLRVGHPGP